MIKKLLIFIIMCIIVNLSSLSIAGVDEELKKKLEKHDFIHSWTYNKSAFKLYINPEHYKENQAPAALLTIRYIFEVNKKKFPKRIEVFDNRGNRISSYPFERIPSIAK